MKQDYVSLMVWAFVKPFLIAGALLGALIAAFVYPKFFYSFPWALYCLR